MAARRPSNLTRRDGVYYFRGFVLKELHSSACRRELRVSLRTTDPAVARCRVRVAALAFDSLCRQIRQMQQALAPDQDIREMVQSFGRTLIREAPPPPLFDGATADYDRDRALLWLDSEIAILEQAVATNDFKAYSCEIDSPLRWTLGHARALAASRFPAGVSPERFNLLCAGIARAQLEERKHYKKRFEDPYAPLTLSDPLFAPPPSSVAPTSTHGPTFVEAVELYIKAKAGIVWTQRTEDENRRILRLASEHFGPGTKISAITLDSVRAFRDSVLAWRKKPSPIATLKEISGAPAELRISAKSAAKYFGYVSAAFSHWQTEGYLEKSPVGKLSVTVPHQSQGTARTPFTPAELTALFSSPIFTGSASLQRRTVVRRNKAGQRRYFGVLRSNGPWPLLWDEHDQLAIEAGTA